MLIGDDIMKINIYIFGGLYVFYFGLIWSIISVVFILDKMVNLIEDGNYMIYEIFYCFLGIIGV